MDSLKFVGKNFANEKKEFWNLMNVISGISFTANLNYNWGP